MNGRPSAPLPATAVAGTGHIAATDHRPNRHGEDGLLRSPNAAFSCDT